jgi:hypothetical protein
MFLHKIVAESKRNWLYCTRAVGVLSGKEWAVTVTDPFYHAAHRNAAASITCVSCVIKHCCVRENAEVTVGPQNPAITA